MAEKKKAAEPQATKNPPLQGDPGLLLKEPPTGQNPFLKNPEGKEPDANAVEKAAAPKAPIVSADPPNGGNAGFDPTITDVHKTTNGDGTEFHYKFTMSDGAEGKSYPVDIKTDVEINFGDEAVRKVLWQKHGHPVSHHQE